MSENNRNSQNAKDVSIPTKEEIEQWLFFLESANPNADATEFFNGEVKALCLLALERLSGPDRSSVLEEAAVIADAFVQETIADEGHGGASHDYACRGIAARIRALKNAAPQADPTPRPLPGSAEDHRPARASSEAGPSEEDIDRACANATERMETIRAKRQSAGAERAND